MKRVERIKASQTTLIFDCSIRFPLYLMSLIVTLMLIEIVYGIERGSVRALQAHLVAKPQYLVSLLTAHRHSYRT
jgi:hypothetical protein